jgi:hypothetical protein
MPFTDSPSNLAPVPSRTERAIRAVTADAGSHDQRQHASPVIKTACPLCDALPNERCADDRYPSGRPRAFAREFHAERVAAAQAGELPLAQRAGESPRHETQLHQSQSS